MVITLFEILWIIFIIIVIIFESIDVLIWTLLLIFLFISLLLAIVLCMKEWIDEQLQIYLNSNIAAEGKLISTSNSLGELTNRISYMTFELPNFDQLFEYENLIQVNDSLIRSNNINIDDIPTINFSTDSKIQNTCSICIDDYTEGETVKILKCGHVYHGNCLEPWLSKSDICPNCKQSII